MGYQRSKDKTLWAAPSKETTIDGQGQRITIGVYAYNGGQPKIGINRFILLQGNNSRPAKLGRLELDEAEYIASYLPEAIRAMQRLRERA